MVAVLHTVIVLCVWQHIVDELMLTNRERDLWLRPRMEQLLQIHGELDAYQYLIEQSIAPPKRER